MGQAPHPNFESLPLWILRIVVATQCLGMAALLMDPSHVSDLHSGIVQMGGGPLFARILDQLAGLWLLMTAATAMTRRLRVVLWVACLWIFLDALSASWVGQGVLSYGSLGSRAARFAAPLGLIFLWPAKKPDALERAISMASATMLLRVAAAATFAVHGLKALAGNPSFAVLLTESGKNVLSLDISTDTAATTLQVIGSIDLLVAGLLIGFRWRTVAWYMAAWGVITAGSRMTAHGWVAWPETLLRAANGGIPLALAIYFGKIKRIDPKRDD